MSHLLQDIKLPGYKICRILAGTCSEWQAIIEISIYL